MVRISSLYVSALAVIALISIEKPVAGFEGREVGAITCVAFLGGFVINQALHWWNGRKVRPEIVALTAQNSLQPFEETLQDLQGFCWDAELIVRNRYQQAFDRQYAILGKLQKNCVDTKNNITQALKKCDLSSQASVSQQLLECSNQYERLLVVVNELKAHADTTKEVVQLDRELHTICRTIKPLLGNNAAGEVASHHLICHALSHETSVTHCLSQLEKKWKRLSTIAQRLSELKVDTLAAYASQLALSAQQSLRLYWNDKAIIEELRQERWVKIEDLKQKLIGKEHQVEELQRSKRHIAYLLDSARSEIRRLQGSILYKEKYEREVRELRCKTDQLQIKLDQSKAEKNLLEQQVQSLSDVSPPPYESPTPLDISPSTYAPSAPPESMMV